MSRTEPSEPSQRQARWATDYVVLSAAVLLLILLRTHAYPAPLEVDECNYAYIGERLAAGDRFYIDAWDHQPPGMFWFSAVLVWLFGSGEIVFRIAATVAAVAALVLIHVICRRSLGQIAASVAVILFALASSDPGVAGEGCNREIYMNLLGAAAVLLLLDGKRWRILLAGLCLGLSSLLKTVVVTQWFALAIGLIAWQLLSRRRIEAGGVGRHGAATGGMDVRENHGAASQTRATRTRGSAAILALQNLALFGASAAIVWVVVCAVLLAGGRFGAFVDATFVYNLGYGQVDTPIFQKLAAFFSHGDEFRTDVFRSAAPLWIVGAIGLTALPWRRDPRFAITISAFTLGSFLAVCLPGRFWNHYYMLMIVPLVITAAAVIDGINRAFADKLTDDAGRARFVALACGGIVIAALAACQWVYYLAKPADRIAAFRYHGRMVWARDHGLRVRQVTDPGDTIYVAGLDAGIYYYSQRTGASRYTMVTHLSGDDPATEKRRQNLAKDLDRNRPRLILIIAGRSAPYIPQLDQYIRDHQYIKVGEDPQKMIVLCDPKRLIAAIDWSSQPLSASSQ